MMKPGTGQSQLKSHNYYAGSAQPLALATSLPSSLVFLFLPLNGRLHIGRQGLSGIVSLFNPPHFVFKSTHVRV